MKTILRRIIEGFTLLVFILTGLVVTVLLIVFIIVGPLALADWTGSAYWLLLYLLMALVAFYYIGKELDYLRSLSKFGN